jgi:predicted RNase H-like nuclease
MDTLDTIQSAFLLQNRILLEHSSYRKRAQNNTGKLAVSSINRRAIVKKSGTSLLLFTRRDAIYAKRFDSANEMSRIKSKKRIIYVYIPLSLSSASRLLAEAFLYRHSCRQQAVRSSVKDAEIS